MRVTTTNHNSVTVDRGEWDPVERYDSLVELFGAYIGEITVAYLDGETVRGYLSGYDDFTLYVEPFGAELPTTIHPLFVGSKRSHDRKIPLEKITAIRVYRS
jgi:hypothetical protein